MAQPIKTTETKPTNANYEFQRKQDQTPVRGKFIYHEVPGGRMDFPYRKFKGEDIVTYHMVDGEILTVPLGVAKHLNANCWYPAYDFKSDEAGRPTCKVSSKVRRCSFQSLEFIDVEGVAPIGSAISGIEQL